jgi:hypothetical protein
MCWKKIERSPGPARRHLASSRFRAEGPGERGRAALTIACRQRARRWVLSNCPCQDLPKTSQGGPDFASAR